MKKAVIILITGFLVTGLLSNRTNAQVGITAVPFLQIEPDSRGAGMGNTGVAIADNAAAIFWNPAGLAFQRDTQISITHANWLPAFNADLFYDYLVGKHYIEGIGTIGGHITFLNLGSQRRTDETGLDLGRFNSFELAAGVSYGFEINRNFALGTGLRFIYSSLASGSVGGQKVSPGSSVGLDLSALYKSDPFRLGNRGARFNAGFNLSNIGPGLQYTDEAQKDALPTILRVGYAFTMNLDNNGVNTITLAQDISKVLARNEEVQVGDDPENTQFESMPVLRGIANSFGSFTNADGEAVNFVEQLMIGTGVEFWHNRQFAIRGGYYYEDPKNGNREFITLGAGLRVDMFGIDFSYIYTLEEESPLSDTIRFSVLLNL